MAMTAAERQRAKRARDKAKASGSVGEATVDDFWQRNRDVANQTRIEELRERESYVLDLVQVMAETIAGDVDLDQSFGELVAADVAQHGICEMEVQFLEFWKRSEMISKLRLNEATKAFVRYGIVAGIPGHRLHEWNTRLGQNFRKKAAKTAEEKS